MFTHSKLIQTIPDYFKESMRSRERHTSAQPMHSNQIGGDQGEKGQTQNGAELKRREEELRRREHVGRKSLYQIFALVIQSLKHPVGYSKMPYFSKNRLNFPNEKDIFRKSVVVKKNFAVVKVRNDERRMN